MPSTDRPTAPVLHKLTGEDARSKASLDKDIAAALNADRWEEAVALADQRFTLLTRVRGPNALRNGELRHGRSRPRRFVSATKEDRDAYRSADAMDKQGIALQRPSEVRRGRDAPRAALEIRRRLLTDNHPDTAISYANVAYLLNAQGKYTQAQPLFEKALEIHRRLLTDEHPDTASTCNNLALNLSAQGKYVQAQPLFEKTLEIRRRLLTDDHADTAKSYNNLATNLNDQGKYAEAEPLSRRCCTSIVPCSRTTTPTPP